MSTKINLRDPNIMGTRQAALIWGKNKGYIRQMIFKYQDRCPKDGWHKFGRSIVVTTEFMEKVTGTPDPRNKQS